MSNAPFIHWPIPRPSLIRHHPELVHHLAPYLGAVSRRQALRLPLAQRQQKLILQAHATAMARNVLWSETIGRVLDGLLDARISFIPVKGIMLAETLYPDPGARPFDDVDLLVPRNHLKHAEAVVTAMGYARFEPHRPRWKERYTHHAVFVRPQGPPFEFHFRLTHELGCADELDDLFANAAPATLRGRPVLTLDVQDQMVHLLTHAASHGMQCGAYWALDLALLVAQNPGIDQTVVANRLEQRRLGPSGAASLFLASILFPALSRDTRPLKALLNRRIRCKLVENLAGPRWWQPPSPGRSARSLATRALIHQRPADLAATVSEKLGLNLREMLDRMISLAP